MQIVSNEILLIDNILAEGANLRCKGCGRKLLDTSLDHEEDEFVCPVCGYYSYDYHGGGINSVRKRGDGTQCYQLLGGPLFIGSNSPKSGVKKFLKFVAENSETVLLAWYTKKTESGYERIFLKGDLAIATLAMEHAIRYGDIRNKWEGAKTRVAREDVFRLMQLVDPGKAEDLVTAHLRGRKDEDAYEPEEISGETAETSYLTEAEAIDMSVYIPF